MAASPAQLPSQNGRRSFINDGIGRAHQSRLLDYFWLFDWPLNRSLCKHECWVRLLLDHNQDGADESSESGHCNDHADCDNRLLLYRELNFAVHRRSDWAYNLDTNVSSAAIESVSDRAAIWCFNLVESFVVNTMWILGDLRC